MLKGLIQYGKLVANTLTGKDPLQIAPAVVFKFTSQQDIDRWHTFTDAFFGGKSTADLQLSPSGDTAVFSGRCSTEQDDDADVTKAGYCLAASKVIAYADYINLEAYSHLVYNVRGDGHMYIANVRVDSMSGSGGDVWQAPFTPRANVWSEVRIPFNSFAMTKHGQLVERRFSMDRGKIISLGVAISAAEADNRPSSSPASDGSVQLEPATMVASGGHAADGQGTDAEASEATAIDFHMELRDVRAEGTATDAGLS